MKLKQNFLDKLTYNITKQEWSRLRIVSVLWLSISCIFMLVTLWQQNIQEQNLLIAGLMVFVGLILTIFNHGQEKRSTLRAKQVEEEKMLVEQSQANASKPSDKSDK